MVIQLVFRFIFCVGPSGLCVVDKVKEGLSGCEINLGLT